MILQLRYFSPQGIFGTNVQSHFRLSKLVWAFQWHLVGGKRDAAEHPALCRIATHNEELFGPKMNNAEIKQPWPRLRLILKQMRNSYEIKVFKSGLNLPV